MNDKDSVILCTCGRDSKRVHCPKCGSLDKYGMSSHSQQVVIDGVERFVATYRCRKCAAKYNDIDRMNCEAPPPLKTKKELGVVERANVDPEVSNAILEKLYERRPELRERAKAVGKYSKPWEPGDPE